MRTLRDYPTLFSRTITRHYRCIVIAFIGRRDFTWLSNESRLIRRLRHFLESFPIVQRYGLPGCVEKSIGSQTRIKRVQSETQSQFVRVIVERINFSHERDDVSERRGYALSRVLWSRSSLIIRHIVCTSYLRVHSSHYSCTDISNTRVLRRTFLSIRAFPSPNCSRVAATNAIRTITFQPRVTFAFLVRYDFHIHDLFHIRILIEIIRTTVVTAAWSPTIF